MNVKSNLLWSLLFLAMLGLIAWISPLLVGVFAIFPIAITFVIMSLVLMNIWGINHTHPRKCDSGK